MQFSAIFVVGVLEAWMVGASNNERVVMAVGFGCGVWSMLLIARLPWGEPRAHWLRPIFICYLPWYVLCVAYGFRAGTDLLVASYAGLISTILVRGVRSRKFRILGLWPKD